MTRKSSVKSAKTKPPREPKAAAAPKKTAEQLSDQERQRLLLHHRRKLKPLLLAEKNAKAAVTTAYELAKKEGVTKKDIATAILLETDEGRDKVQGEIQRLLTIDRHTGSEIAVQLELFAKQDSRERNFEAGRLAALDDRPAKPPAHLSQQAEKHWLEGHADGLTQLNQQRLQGFRKLGDVAQQVTGGTEGGDDIGSEPATHKEAA